MVAGVKSPAAQPGKAVVTTSVGGSLDNHGSRSLNPESTLDFDTFVALAHRLSRELGPIWSRVKTADRYIDGKKVKVLDEPIDEFLHQHQWDTKVATRLAPDLKRYHAFREAMLSAHGKPAEKAESASLRAFATREVRDMLAILQVGRDRHEDDSDFALQMVRHVLRLVGEHNSSDRYDLIRIDRVMIKDAMATIVATRTFAPSIAEVIEAIKETAKKWDALGDNLFDDDVVAQLEERDEYVKELEANRLLYEAERARLMEEEQRKRLERERAEAERRAAEQRREARANLNAQWHSYAMASTANPEALYQMLSVGQAVTAHPWNGPNENKGLRGVITSMPSGPATPLMLIDVDLDAGNSAQVALCRLRRWFSIEEAFG